MQQCIF